MAEARKKREKGSYRFVDLLCIGRECWAPGEFQHRGATMSGSRATGATTLCCVTNAYHGCPYEGNAKLPFSESLAKQRKEEGWSIRG